MVDDAFKSTIADASQPNAGRVYDYLLGGSHNFEVDRIAGEQLRKLQPLMAPTFRLIRWFLSEAARRLADQGFTHFLDFASGLPTVDHIHVVVPEGSKIIYSDLDSVTVRYGQEITHELQNVQYLECDAGTPETILNSGIVEELFGKNRKVAIGYNGILWFLPDEQVSHALRVLYEWAETGSIVYLTTDESPDSAMSDPRYKELAERYKKMNQPFFPKNRKKVESLTAPWRVAEPGFKFIEEWLDLENTVNKELGADWKGLGMYGGFLIKE